MFIQPIVQYLSRPQTKLFCHSEPLTVPRFLPLVEMTKEQIVPVLSILLLTLSQTTGAEGLLRLFTTPQERAMLNAERSKPLPPPPKPSKPPPKPSKPPPPSTTTKQSNTTPPYITFNGLVIRNDGQTIVWINGSQELTQQGFTVELEKMTDELSVPIVLSNTKQRIFLKPGQTLNTLNGTIQEQFEKP